MKTKIEDEGNLNEKELLMLSLLCFMNSEKNIPDLIHESATIITNIANLNNDIAQFVKGIILMLCDKFVDDELLNTRIINKVGGNMKVVEDYTDRVAERKVNEKNETFVIRLRKKGFKIEEIAETADVSRDFVEKILAKVES
jgi:predicted transcriptional regulator